MLKESFDNLPVGLCFFDQNGIAVLCNRQMQRLFHLLAGHDLQALPDLRALLDGYPVTAPGHPDILLTPGIGAWRFTLCTVEAGGAAYTQAIVADVTELYRARQELQKDNRRLAADGERIRRLMAGMKDVIRDEEIVSAKIRVHKQVGDGLVKIRRLLVQRRPTAELDVSDWRRAIRLLQRDNRTPDLPERENLDALRKTAREMGVAVRLTGVLPAEPAAHELMLLAIRECVTNTVRHAGGDEVYAACAQTAQGASIRIVNNGRPPQGAIVEHGGLGSLRGRVEQAGGTMTIETAPRFALTVTVPEKEGSA